MNCQRLAARIKNLQPDAEPADIARLCLVLLNETDTPADLQDDECLTTAYQAMNFKLQAAADQHAAMTSELEELAASDPEKFQPEQVWILVRAIKVQSQILQLYLGQPALDV